jgi:adenosine kinase
MNALICGSMAYDTIMVFHDKFKHHILPEKTHILNVSFLVPTLRREFGGCAGNIAYNLKLLGAEPLIMATVGHDFEPYSHWLTQHKIEQKFIQKLDNQFTGQAYITTDEDDNQITAFHPGAMNSSHLNSVSAEKNTIQIGIVSPDGKEGMMLHAKQFAELEIPFIFDPGQGMPMFNGTELLALIEQATWLTLNDYEAELMQEKTGLNLEQLAQKVNALIVTRGGDGSTIYTNGTQIHIPTAAVKNLADPTGCGDAYRAGLLYGLLNNLEWEVTGRIASLLGAIKIEHHGTQNHWFNLEKFKHRYNESFGSTF